jgi:uncharacterized protein
VTNTIARSRERKERLEDILVVDADVHVHESPGALIPYCEMPWRVALENIKDVQEFYLDIPGFSPGTTAYEAKFPSGQEATRMVHDAEQMRRELDEIHVDIGILFPDPRCSCTASPSSTLSSPSTRRASRPSSGGTSAAIPSR